MVTIISTLTVIVSLISKVWGFPNQIKLLHKFKRTDNISLVLHSLATLSYALWTLHGVLRNDWFTVVGQGLGVVFSAIIVYLVIKYRKPEDEKTTHNSEVLRQRVDE